MPSGSLLRRLFLALACLSSLVACSSRESPMLLEVTAITPRSLEPGDVVEVNGVGFPAGKPATVTLEGQLARAGALATDFSATFPAEGRSGNQLSFTVDPALEAAICGGGAAATHATFRGRAVVVFAPRIAGAPPVSGALDGVKLEIFPGRQMEPEAKAAETARLLAFLGVELAGVSLDAPSVSATSLQGLRISRVVAKSRAEQAGLRLDDLIVGANGVTVIGPEDLIPAVQNRTLDLAVQRGEAHGEVIVSVPVVGFSRVLPEALNWAASLVLAGVFAIICLALWPGRAWAYLSWCFAQRNAAAPQALASSAARSIRAVAPSLLDTTFAAVAVAGLFVHFASRCAQLGVALGTVLIAALVLRLLLGFVTSGLDPHHGFKFFRAVGATCQLFLVEIGSLCALIPLTLGSSSLKLQDAVSHGSALPWEWPALKSPFGLLLLGLFLAPAVLDATGARAQLDFGGESRRVASSRAFGLLDWILVLFKCGVGASLFLGGPAPGAAFLGFGSIGNAIFLLKYAALVLVLAQLRRALDFPRADEIAFSYLRWVFLPLCGFALFSLVSFDTERYAVLRWLCNASGYGTCGVAIVLCGLAVVGLRRASENAPATSINPWL